MNRNYQSNYCINSLGISPNNPMQHIYSTVNSAMSLILRLDVGAKTISFPFTRIFVAIHEPIPIAN